MKTPSPAFLDYMTRCWTEYHGPFDGPAEIPAMPPAFLRGALYALEYVEPEKIPERTFIVPYEVPSQNAKGHWSKGHKISCQWMMAAIFHNGKRKEHRKMRMRLVCYRKKLCTDIANLYGGAKKPIDGIKRSGLIVDDSDRWCHIEYEQHLAKESPTKKPCTVVMLWPMEEK
jgi:hypothetical protein